MIDHADRMVDWQHMIHAIERTPPLHPPGERTGYHGLTYGYLVGELLQRVTGRPFARLVQDELVAPLGLDGMYIGAPKRALSRAAKLMWSVRESIGPTIPFGLDAGPPTALVRGGAAVVHALLRLLGIEFDLASILDGLAPRGISQFDFGAERTLRASIPAANGLFTARSLARMYAALAGGGAIDGVRLLSRHTLQRATRVQERPRGRRVIPWEMRWRLGYHGVVTTRGIPRRAFGHFGFGGSGGWADPHRDLAAALIVNSGMGSPFGDLRILRLSGAVLAAVERRPLPARRASVTAIGVARPRRAVGR
jgi:CubicO group peptidase (beta-lactamase class C family)